MQEMLIRSPATAFAFGIDTSQFGAAAPGPSHAARPPAERRLRALRWHPASDQQGQPCGCWEMFVRGWQAKAPPSGASRLRAAPYTLVRLCFSPWKRCTTEPAHSIGLARCTSVQPGILAQAGSVGKAAGLQAQVGHVRLTLPLKQRDLRRTPSVTIQREVHPNASMQRRHDNERHSPPEGCPVLRGSAGFSRIGL